MTTTYYQILELPEQASAADIRRAYLRLVQLTHPDRTPDPAAHRRYLLVNEAYDTLRQPSLRARYDARLAEARRPPRPAAPAYTQPFGGNAYQVLRVPYSATLAQIEQAYQRLSQQLRAGPADPGLRAYLAQVEHAYATLTTPALRLPHDARVRGQRPKPAEDPYAAAYSRLARYARPLCRVLAAFFLLIVLDRYLLLTFRNEPVTETSPYPSNFAYTWVRTPHAAFRVRGEVEIGERYDVERSAVLRQVSRYQFRPAGGGLAELVPYDESAVHGNMFFFPALMGLFALIGCWPRLPARRAVDFAIFSSLVALIVLYLLTAL